MTNQNFDFSQPFNNTNVNMYGNPITTSASEEFQRHVWRRLRSPNPEKYIVQELTVYSVQNGYQDRGQLVGAESSTLDGRYGLTLGPLVSTTTLGSATGGAFTSWCHFGTDRVLVLANGDVTNFCLFTETSATNPVIVAKTYNPAGSVINNVVPIVQGSATAAEALAVCQAGAAIEILDTSFASVGSMDSTTADCHGFVTSPFNAASVGAVTHLIPAGNTFYTLSSAVAVGTAPTAALTGVPNGIRPIGVDQLQKARPLEAYWFYPLQSGAPLNQRYPQTIRATKLDLSTQPEPIDMGIERIWGGALWNRTLVAFGGPKVTSFDGETTRDLHFSKNRAIDSAFRWDCVDIAVHKGDLYAVAQRTDLAASSGAVGNSTAVLERCVPEFDAWVPVGSLALGTGSESSSAIAPLGDTDLLYNHSQSLPISLQTSYLHYNLRSSTDWKRAFISPTGIEPYRHYNGAGGSDNIAQGFATSGTFTSNEFPIPGAGRNPTVLYEIDATQIDTATGGSTSKLEVEWAAQSTTGQSWSFSSNLSAEFKGSDPQAKMYKNFWQNTSSFTMGKFRLNATQGSTTTRTGNYLPVTFRMITYLEGEVTVPPITVLGGVT